MPVRADGTFDELQWRLRQWKRLGLAYIPERIERLAQTGEIAATFVVRPPNETQPDTFVPEPFPVPPGVYEHVMRSGDVVGGLTRLAHLKRSHERGGGGGFPSSDEQALYCAFIARFYALHAPYRGKQMYWILFDDSGIHFFSAEFGVDEAMLERFSAGYVG